MNKKFLSAILFGALMVSSTGTFVSCKDYDDDIKDLQGQIDKLVTPETLNTQIAQLQANIDAAKQSATSELATAKAALEAAIAGKADAAVITNLTEKVTAAQTKVDNLEDKLGTIESTLNSVKSDVDNLKQNAGKAEMAEIDRRIKELRNELLAIIGDKLSSLVFVPSLYENGIEATRYPYAQGVYKALTGKSEGKKNAEGANFTIAEKNTFANVATEGNYTIGSFSKAVYHVNPTTANLTNVAWGFLYSEPEYVDASVRAAATPKPIYSTSKQLANGDLEVVYKVENPADLKIVADKNVSVMALTGTYQDEEAKDTTVTSDYAAILPAVVTFKAIAFNTLETENDACTLGAKQHELYIKGEDAAQKDATIDVKYNGGTLDLTQYLNVHYTQADIKAAAADAEHQIMAYANVADYGLHFEYEMLGYKTGSNNTEENKYGTVDNKGIFTPCYVQNGNTIPCSTGEDGISAVGRTPIVLVKLMDGENMVLAGYVKLHIVKDLGIQTLPEVFNATVPYVCDGFKDGIKWDDMSGEIIEALKMTKAEFVNSFNFVTGKTYITKDSQKTFTEVANNIYGDLTISSDFTDVSTTNDVITWTADFNEMDAISKLPGRTITLYACFQSKTDTKFFVYVPFTVTIAAKPEVTFGDKIKAYWYPTKESTVAKRDTVRMNVPRPATDDKTVKDYYKDLDDYFEGNVVKVAKTSATQNQYYDLKPVSEGGLGTAYSYEFAAAQPEIVDPNQANVKYQLVRGIDPTKLYVGAADVAGNLVASIAADGTLTYATTDNAKKLLNLYGHLIPEHFANVEIVATYDYCKLALGTENFKVRFLRPVDVLDGDQAKFIDAQANGSSIVLGDLFDLKDWREEALIVKNANGLYESAVENGVTLYPYYEFSTIKVDIANAKCDLTGTVKKVSEVTDKLKLYVTENGVENATNTVSIANVGTLNTTKIVYKNNEGNVQKFTLWIPVEITYYWGTLKAVAKCDVESTKANQ